MYSSSYARAKLGPDSRGPLHRSRGKSCGYYMRIVFFFSSLIQSLIIVSLVLFLIYGQPEKSAEERRVMELEQGFNKMSENNVQLRKEKGELAAQLTAQTAEKAALVKEMEKLNTEANKTINYWKNKHTTCDKMLQSPRSNPPIMPPPPPPGFSLNEKRNLENTIFQHKAMIELINTNFTQTFIRLSQERNIVIKHRDMYKAERDILHQENLLLKETIETHNRKCKEDFAQSLGGIQNVTTTFLEKINNLFPHQMTFHLTCGSQREQLEKIKNGCTNLSRDVESKFQLYLDNVGNRVAEIQFSSSQLATHNKHLSSELQECKQNRSDIVAKCARDLQQKQMVHDDKVEELLKEQKSLRAQQNLQEERLNLKVQEIQTLQGMLPNSKASPLNTTPSLSGSQQAKSGADVRASGGASG